MPYAELMMRIEDVIVKTILCAEPLISDACRIFQSHRGNCFGKAFVSKYLKALLSKVSS